MMYIKTYHPTTRKALDTALAHDDFAKVVDAFQKKVLEVGKKANMNAPQFCVNDMVYCISGNRHWDEDTEEYYGFFDVRCLVNRKRLGKHFKYEYFTDGN